MTPEMDPSKVRLPELFTVCIIGASQGTGEHIAYAYARAHAARIVISSRSLHDLEAVADKIKSINSTIQTDVVEV